MRSTLVAVCVLVGASVAHADQPVCVGTPFQLSGHTDLAPTDPGGVGHTITTVQLPHTASHIEQVTATLHNPTPDLNGNSVRTFQVAVQLNGQSIAHGIELPSLGGSPYLAANAFGVDLLRLVSFYADGESNLVFTADWQSSYPGGTGSIDITVVGQTIPKSCGGKN